MSKCKECKFWKIRPSWKDGSGLCTIRSDWMNVVSRYPNDKACEYFIKKEDKQ